MDNIYEFSNNLKSIISNSNQVILVPHIFSDIDALSSCFAMFKLASLFNKKVYILFNDDINKIDNSARKLLADITNNAPLINLSTYNNIKSDNDLVITLDFNKKDLICDKELLKNKVIVIDHHNLDEDHIDSTLKYVDLRSSSATEIMYHLLTIFGVKIDKTLSNALLAGIYLDTNEFKNILNYSTMYIIGELMRNGADLKKIREYFSINYDEDRKIQHLVDKSFNVIDNIKLSVGNSKTIYKRSELAKVADYLLKFNLEASFATGFVDKDLIAISSRSTGNVDVSKIMKEFDGGGSRISAAARISSNDIKPVEKKLKYIIKNLNI